MFDMLLRLLGLSTSIPPPTGKFKYVGVLPFRFPESCFAKIFYPASSDDNSAYKSELDTIQELYDYKTAGFPCSGSYRYTRPGVITGMSKWVKTPSMVFYLSIGHNSVPFKFLLPPADNDIAGKGNFPVVIFSHGLGGNADIYSKFCMDVASHGYIVIALEHEDGSGSFAIDRTTNEPIFYKPPPEGMPYTRQTVLDFRKPFLEHRVAEVEKVVEFLKSGDKHLEQTNLFKVCPELEQKLFNLMDTDTLYMAGHSFGGATTLCVLNHYEKHPMETNHSTFKAAVLLDVWSYPVPQNVIDSGIRTPFISILSEAFTSAIEIPVTKEIFKNSGQALRFSAYMKNITHTQFSDGPWFSGLSSARKKFLLEGEYPGLLSQKAITQAVGDFFDNPLGSSEKLESHLNDDPLIKFEHL